ncbi:MAG: 30S ribosomal protein S13 [Candidatus Nanoarchaeia archaeon]|nr:30S ribosomal protein S13 [Candidatus Nanoarchaeia archaeon]
MEKSRTEPQTQSTERIVRILSKDIEGGMTLYAGLAKIKGISWAFSNALCKSLGIDKAKKIGSLTEEEIKRISEFARKPILPSHFMNRRKDRETGQDRHLIGVDLDLIKEFDIKRLKQIRNYRGIRHSLGLTTRGQRTKGNFRRNRSKGVGIKKKAKPETKRQEYVK